MPSQKGNSSSMPGSKNSPVNPSVQSEPQLENEIQKRAYELYLQRGQDGRALNDWLQAEEELRASDTRTQAPASATSARVA